MGVSARCLGLSLAFLADYEPPELAELEAIGE